MNGVDIFLEWIILRPWLTIQIHNQTKRLQPLPGPLINSSTFAVPSASNSHWNLQKPTAHNHLHGWVKNSSFPVKLPCGITSNHASNRIPQWARRYCNKILTWHFSSVLIALEKWRESMMTNSSKKMMRDLVDIVVWFRCVVVNLHWVKFSTTVEFVPGAVIMPHLSRK